MTIFLAVIAALIASACGGEEEDADQTAGAPDSGPSLPNSQSGPSGEHASAGARRIRITFDDTGLTGWLDDNATARDLAAQLPLRLTFRDHNGVEKTAPLPRELSIEGAPEGHDPVAGEIGYWAPDGDLVFYYDSDAPFFNGIVRIGEVDGAMDAFRRQSEDFFLTVDRSK